VAALAILIFDCFQALERLLAKRMGQINS